MCPLTAGKNISSNYSPQAHSFCLSPDKGIWNPGCQRGMLKTVEWISLGRGNNSWRTLNQLGMVITRMYIQRHPLGLALHVFGNCFKPRMFSWNNYEMFIAISNSKCRDSFCFGHISLKKKIWDVVTGEKYNGWMADRHHCARCSRIAWHHIHVSLLHRPALSTFCKGAEGSAGFAVGPHTPLVSQDLGDSSGDVASGITRGTTLSWMPWCTAHNRGLSSQIMSYWPLSSM